MRLGIPENIPARFLGWRSQSRICTIENQSTAINRIVLDYRRPFDHRGGGESLASRRERVPKGLTRDCTQYPETFKERVPLEGGKKGRERERERQREREISGRRAIARSRFSREKFASRSLVDQSARDRCRATGAMTIQCPR
jgi:hypothetical protein